MKIRRLTSSSSSRALWWIALRFLFSLRGQRFLFLLTSFGVLLSVGTISLTYVVVSCAESFSDTLRHQLLLARPHLELSVTPQQSADAASFSKLLTSFRADPRVRDAFPVLVGSVLVASERGTQGAQAVGVDPSADPFFSDWRCFSDTHGEQPIAWQAFDAEAKDVNGLPGIVLGRELANSLEVGPNETISLVYPMGDIDPFGNPLPLEQRFVVRGVCESGVYAVDLKWMMMSERDLRGLLLQGQSGFTSVWALLKNPFEIDRVLVSLEKVFAPWGPVRTWKTANQALFGALVLERRAVIGVIALVFALASLTLYGMLSVLVLEKRADFSVLYTLGLSEQSGMGILFRMAFVLAMLGAGVGILVGVIAVYGVSLIAIPLPDAYYIQALHVTQQPLYALGIVGLGVIIQMLAAILPAYWLKRESPVDALRAVEGGVI